MSFGARALIRLGALKHNFDIIRAATPGAKIMAVIKANAYGHGMVAVAKNLPDVDAFAVARVPEAIRLRYAGVDNRIVLLAGALNADELRDVIRYDFETVVHCPEQIALLENVRHGNVCVWLKFDTGMNRLGFAPESASAIIERVGALPSVGEVRLMTHLSSADEQAGETTKQQLSRFLSLLENFDGPVSIANTPGALGWPDLIRPDRENWIRPGIALFGISPFADRSASALGLKPVMQFEARLIAVKPLAKGASVGYKGNYTADADTLLGIVSAGYGDGYTRHFKSGTPVLLNGRRVPVIGNVSMDMVAVDLGPDASDEVGDIATLWGDGLPVEEVAPWAGAIPYELVCGVMNREKSDFTT
ncbi:MAG: alanine racemase [Pseudomonadota bacterium]